MAEITVSGTKILTQNGPTTISAPDNTVYVQSDVTNVTGDLIVNNTATILRNLDVRGTWTTVIIKPNDDNVNNAFGVAYNPSNIYDTAENRRQGAVYIGGGVGIEKDLNVGGYIYGRVSQATTSLQILVSPTTEDVEFYPIFARNSTGIADLYSDEAGLVDGLRYNPSTGKLRLEQLQVASSLTSTSPTTGALTVGGGVGIRGTVHIESTVTVYQDILPSSDLTSNLGSSTTNFAEAYLENIYTKLLRSNSGPIQIQPKEELTEVYGNFRVIGGDKPIGTAPVVTNILYVTVDGNDTNDGRAMDSSRACRTIGGAINSPYYQPGTQIQVAPGRYLEDNPLRLKPYTTIRGADLRTTFVEPINKTQDLFHVDSGCYITGMTFLNGRSGLLEGTYAPGFNRGAYCTAFPPLTGDDRIDLFHSPYIQNCTNQSGPWLKDGTLFQPNQTVQVPLAVGTGTWVANTTSIVVNVSTGTITRGMSVNSGQQNPGFFNARTLMLANKPFLQEQTVKYVNDLIVANTATTSSIWYGFVYNEQKCFRDVGILVENVAYDAAFGGNQKSVESGLAYYNGVVSLIAGQEQQTTEAINYLNSLTQLVIINTTATDLYNPGEAEYSQVINWVLTGGSIASNSINSLFFTITNIINNGPDVAPQVYKSTGPDAAFVSAEVLMQANRAFIQQDTINWINNTYLPFPYSEIKCRRDTGLIIDSVLVDMLYYKDELNNSTFAGLQYWKQDDLIPNFLNDFTTTTSVVSYLKELSGKIIRNITEAEDLIPRYQSLVTQNTSTYQPATLSEVSILNDRFDEILEILSGKTTGWSDRIISNGLPSNLISVQNASNNLRDNVTYLAAEIAAFLNETSTISYNIDDLNRDVAHIIYAVAFDLLHGGNRQSIQQGLYFYDFSISTSTVETQTTQTIAAFNYLESIIGNVSRNIPVNAKQNFVKQIFTNETGTEAQSTILQGGLQTIKNIIESGPSVASTNTGAPLLGTPNVFQIIPIQEGYYAFNNIKLNKDFLIEETIAFIDQTYNPYAFNYDEAKCYRDIGLIVDAVSQDILLGGNQKSVEAGLAYWSAGYNYVSGQVSTTTAAINHARDISLQIIANQTVDAQTGTIIQQVINPFFQYGGDYMPQEAVTRNFGIITKIIEDGPLYAPPIYAGGGLFSLTGLNGSDVIISPTVTAVYTVTTGTYLIGLSTSTIGFGNEATLYFGNTTVFPYRDNEVEELSYEYTRNTSTWNQRKIDPIGSMGGSLVDGNVISSRSPIQSFVYDAFTQVTQGGRGVHIKNDGYAQLVSVFTIFCSVGVEVESGGIASIVNSNANFGNICLLAKGFGKRKFTGHVYNPVFKAYPESPSTTEDFLDQYYPLGYWPNAARIRVFLPDLDNRPHISLVMEVEPPEGYLNDIQLPGFLNATPTKGILNTGTIVIEDIDTDGIAIGNYVFIRDQEDNRNYVSTGTIVTDIGYRSVTLNKALVGGGQDPLNTENSINDNWFELYFYGNAYYTVLSSEISDNPKFNRLNQEIPLNVNVLSTASTGWLVDQIVPHAQSLSFLNSLTNQIISNQTISPVINTTTNQTLLPLVVGGSQSSSFINQRFDIIKNILTATNITAAEAVIPSSLRTKEGTVPNGAGSAITLIKSNIDFLADEVSAYVETNFYPSFISSGLSQETLDYITKKCQRDIKIILQRIIYDLETGGRYNSVMAGLSYWNRYGTYHIVQLGENVRRPDLFPDGSVINFYQRSYMSASGYVFEYVGAGIDYGALPQVGRADPVQGKETVQLSGGKVFFTSTDQNGDFRIGPGLVISQATGVLSGRTFTRSLFANLTPFILAIEGAGG
jgi:hypothetical protein